MAGGADSLAGRTLNSTRLSCHRSPDLFAGIRPELGLILEFHLPVRFPAVVYQSLPSVIWSAPPLQEEAVDPLARHEDLARLGAGRDIGRKTVEALGQSRGHRDGQRHLLRC